MFDPLIGTLLLIIKKIGLPIGPLVPPELELTLRYTPKVPYSVVDDSHIID
jgi:hypothetical protein